MLNKFIPLALAASSLGGSCFLVTSFVESEIRVKEIINDGLKEDLDRLRERNPEAFKVSKNDQHSVGSAWKTNAKGTIHQDKTYFVFNDWSWLNGVKIGGAGGKEFSGGQNLKSYVDGIGLKVEKINDKWEYKDNSWQNTRDIEVKRVLTKGGYQFQTSKGTCLLRITDKPATKDSSLYLLIGFAKLDTNKIGKPNYVEFIEGYESFCANYANGRYGSKIRSTELAVSFDVVDGKITGNEYPEIADNSGLRPLRLEKNGIKVSPVVLSFAIKGQMTDTVGEWAGKHLNKQQAEQEIKKKISKNIVGIFSGNKMTGLKIKETNGENKLKGERSEEDWISTAKVTYKT